MIIVRLAERFPKEIERGLIPNIFYISKYQVEQGHKVYIFALDKKGSSEDIMDGVRIFRVKKPPLVRTFGGMTLLKAVKRKGIKPDIVHGLQTIPFGWLFPWARRYLKTKYVLSVHGTIFPLQKSRARDLRSKLDSLEFSKLIRFLAKRVDLVFPVADFIKEELILVGIPKKKIKVMPTGVNFEIFNRRRTVEKSKTFTVLNVGRFVQKKGLPYLIKAINLFRKEDIRLLLIGGKKEDNDYKNITDLIQKLNLQKKITIKESLPQNKLSPIYQSSDVFVLSSIMEPRGKVILEAMAAGVPVIATKQGGVPEVVKNKINGLLVSVKDEKAIAQAINRRPPSPGGAPPAAFN